MKGDMSSDSSNIPRNLSALVRRVVSEVRTHFASDRCAFVPRLNTQPIHHAAAALSHCCVLLEELDAARRRSETTARLLARAHCEAWLVGMYLVFGGMAALEHVAGAYKRAIRVMQNELDALDKRIAAAHRKTERKNVRIRKANARRQLRNASGGDARPLKPEIPSSDLEKIGFDVSNSAAYNLDVPEAELRFAEVASRLGPMARHAGAKELNFELMYHLVYRGLSTLGAHPTLWVLDQYLSWPRNFLRVSSAIDSAPIADGATYVALVMTAILSQQVLQILGCETPEAEMVVHAE